MRRLQLWSLIVFAALVMAIVPAYAQSTWCHTWNFVIESGEVDGISGEVDPPGYISDWSSGNGWYGTVATDMDRLFVEQTFDDPTPHILTASFSWTTVTDIALAGSWFGINGDFGDDTALTSGQTSAESPIDDTITKLRIGIERGGFSTTIVTEYLTSYTITGTGTKPDFTEGGDEDCTPPDEEEALTRPLQPEDRSIAFQSVGYADNADEPAVLGNFGVVYGGKTNSLVSAVASGTVTEIEPIDVLLGGCYDYLKPELPNNASYAAVFADCPVTIVGNENDSSAGKYAPLYSGGVPPSPLFVIHIDGDDGREYLQLVTDYQNYVYEGQHVEAGCYLGRVANIPTTSTLDKVTDLIDFFDQLPVSLSQLYEWFGVNDAFFEALTVAWVKEGGSFVDAWDEYILDPSDSAPCNSPEGYEGCMGDTRMEDATQWQSSNGVSWLDSGALMNSGSFIRSTFNLDADRNPRVIIGAYAIPLGILSVSFGTASDPINQILGMSSFEFEAGDPDAGAFYTLELKNTGDAPIRLDFVCVIHETDRSGNPQNPNDIPDDQLPPDVIQAPGTQICYFTDASFENGLDEWDQTGDVEEDDGVLLLPDDATIAQDLKLKAGTYTLKVIVRLWTNGAYSPDDDDDSNGVEIEYAYPATTFVTVGGMQAWNRFAIKSVATLSAEIVIADDEDGTFTLRANVVSPPTGVLGVQVQSACLTKAGDVDAGDGDGLIKPTCGSIPTPTLSATAPGTWFTWLWAQSNKFFRCELIRVINAMYSAMTQFFRTVLWSIRWMQASAIRTGSFANVALYWLNGHLYNVAVGQVYTVVGGEGFDVSGDIGDVILGGLKSVIDLFISLLQRIIDFVFYLLNLVFVLALDIVVALVRIGVMAIGFIISVLGQFFDLVNALFFAWNNSAAAPIAGVPQCAVEPKENPVCIALWMAENTIFSGRGFLFIPFMVAYGSAELLLWAISKLSKNAKDSAQGG